MGFCPLANKLLSDRREPQDNDQKQRNTSKDNTRKQGRVKEHHPEIKQSENRIQNNGKRSPGYKAANFIELIQTAGKLANRSPLKITSVETKQARNN